MELSNLTREEYKKNRKKEPLSPREWRYAILGFIILLIVAFPIVILSYEHHVLKKRILDTYTLQVRTVFAEQYDMDIEQVGSPKKIKIRKYEEGASILNQRVEGLYQKEAKEVAFIDFFIEQDGIEQKVSGMYVRLTSGNDQMYFDGREDIWEVDINE